jgi:hypothetical protein
MVPLIEKTMLLKRRIARRWTPEQIEQMAIVPDLKKADERANELSGLIAAFWYAATDEGADKQIEIPEFDLGQPGESIPE